MYLDYSTIKFDVYGRPEYPELKLQTLGGHTIGILTNVFDLKIHIKFSEPSTISFSLAKNLNDSLCPFYDETSGHKIIYTADYGIYRIDEVVTTGDGLKEIKEVTASSIESELEYKRFFLEEGTFNFWNPVDSNDTIIGRIMEIAIGWNVGYISPTLIGRYRTFSQCDDDLLSFVYNTSPEKFRCVFVFDPYDKTINVYDADEERSCLPIYLDFDNLIDELEVEELCDELVTAIRPYGADNLDIRAVNPIGTNWIYDLSYFIANGDIPPDLANKWLSWQKLINANRDYYSGLISMTYNNSARILSEKASLVDLENELTDLINQQSVIIQAIAMEESGSSGEKRQKELLSEVNRQIKNKKSEIEDKESIISDLTNESDTKYLVEAQKINQELNIHNYFTESEYETLSKYFIEQDFTDDSFVSSDIGESVSGTSISFELGNISLTNSDITKIDLTQQYSKIMFVLSGGTFNISSDSTIYGDIIRGTLEIKDTLDYVLSLYMGNFGVDNASYSSGLISIVGTISEYTDDITDVYEEGIVSSKGTTVNITAISTKVYISTNVSEYQTYSVQSELLECATSVLSDLATPTYEFSLKTGNFIFAKDFKPFRNSLQLGNGIYLKLNNSEIITPYIIEFELDFEKQGELSLVFSNRFKRHDNVNTLKDMIEKSYSSSRSFDASKYIYNQSAKYTPKVTEFMQSSLNAAVNNIIGATNQSVIIDGSGINVGGDSNYQLRIIDNMIAMTDDNWESSKLAIGKFSSENIGTYWGINAEVVGGKLIVGNNLVIENATDEGVMQFKVDSSGAWLNNSVFVLQADNGGKILIHPDYGIAAGTSSLYTTDGTKVIPSFIDSDGDVIFDDSNLPDNANFYLDIKDGSAYLRGTVNAVSGSIGGWDILNNCLYSGSNSTYVALNASSSDNALYAIWAGASSPANAPFYVKRDGTLHASQGEFSGTLSAARLSGNLTADSDGWLIGCGINIGDGVFKVDQKGNVTMTGNITWGSSNSPSVSDDDIFDILTENETRYGFYNSGGKLAINADYIKSGSLDADLITTGELSADYIKLGGQMTVYESTTSSRTGGYIGYWTTGMKMSDSSEDNFVAVDSWGARLYNGSKGMQVSCEDSEITFSADYDFSLATNFKCNKSGVSALGTSSYLWSTVYASTGTINTSDANKKNSITYDLSCFEDFYKSLKPSRFKYNDGTSDRFHLGFISQDVEESLLDNNLSSLDFAGFIKSPRYEVTLPNGEFDENSEIVGYDYSLRYAEFVPLNTFMIQKLINRVSELEYQLSEYIEAEEEKDV